MKKRIFIIGQCTLHWGRMEFGNIGNYYIVEPMFEELRRVFPHEEIATTMQFSAEFRKKFELTILPMEIYYDFGNNLNLQQAINEYQAVLNGGDMDSPYIEELKKADLVIDFSGDIWGDNADFLGTDRFMTGLYKDMCAQLLKPTVMIAGSPGPFGHQKEQKLIHKAFGGFQMVVNREHISTRLLNEQGFDVSHVQDYPCPSFLFEPASDVEVKRVLGSDFNFDRNRINIGVMLCGWNFEQGPFDLWPREDEEYINFCRMVENLINKYSANIYLLSHSNGFAVPPAPFELKHGRDFGLMEQFADILNRKFDHIKLFRGIYTPEVTKGIISNFDMLISGRMHGAVAGISQCIPTVIIDYGHEPKAHKLKGFAEIAGLSDYIADPNDSNDLRKKTERCMEHRDDLRSMLRHRIPQIKMEARKQFDLLKDFVYKEQL